VELGATDYVSGAQTRIDDADVLYDGRRWVATVYLAGRAVEAMLRALLWTKSREQEIGHDLRGLLRRIGSLGLLTSTDEQHMLDAVQVLAPVWHNNLRFAGRDTFLQMLRTVGRHVRIGGQRVTGDPDKANAYAVLQAAHELMARGELVWHRLRTS